MWFSSLALLLLFPIVLLCDSSALLICTFHSSAGLSCTHKWAAEHIFVLQASSHSQRSCNIAQSETLLLSPLNTSTPLHVYCLSVLHYLYVVFLTLTLLSSAIFCFTTAISSTLCSLKRSPIYQLFKDLLPSFHLTCGTC